MSATRLAASSALLALALAMPAPSEAAGKGARCSFDDSSRVLKVVVERDPAGPPSDRSGFAYLAVVRGFVRVLAGASLTEIGCGGTPPTRYNVEAVEVDNSKQLSSTSLFIDQRFGRFAPGNTDEGDGSSEIEFDLDLGPRGLASIFLTPGDDAAFVRDLASGDLVDLNAFESPVDIDVFVRPGTSVFLNGAAGDDLLAATAIPPGPYDPYSYLATGGFGIGLFGNGGADGLFGSQESDALVGGAGRDVIDAGPGRDAVVSADRPPRPDRVDCGPGRDRLEPDRRDHVAGCERRSRLVRRVTPDHLPHRLRLRR